MKTVVIFIALAIAAGIASVVIWKSSDVSSAGQSPSAGAVAPVEDVAVLKTKAAAGDADAAYKLASALVKGEQGLPNYSEAARLFQVAADKGHPEAMVVLAELYTLGQGVTNNPTEALRLYLAAAQKGNVRALYSLAGLYEEGRGMKKDQALAAKFHRLAAERGQAVAQFNLGQRYELGMGVKADLIEAFMWLRLASKNGIADASEMLPRVQKKMTKEQIAEATRRVNEFSVVTVAPVLTNEVSP